MKRLLLATVILAIACHSDPLLESSERKITVTAPIGTGKYWLEFALRADKDVQRFLNTQAPPTHTLRLRVGSEGKQTNPLHLAFTGREYRTEISRRIYQGLLLRAVTPAGRKPPTLTSTGWMTAALTAHETTADHRTPGRTPADYEPARIGFREGIFPDVRRLLTQPVPASTPLLYHFYGLHCDLLAAAIRSETPFSDAPFRRILDLEAHGRDTITAVEFVLQPSFTEGETLQAWYQRIAPDVSRKGRRQSAADEVAQRLADLTTVPTIAMNDGAKRIKRVPIEELPERLKDYRLDTTGLTRIHGRIFDLLQDAPVLLRDPLTAYMDAFSLLAKGKTRSFRRAIQRARREFDQAVKRQQAVEALLDRIQEDYSAPAEHLAPYLDVVKRADDDLRALAPAMHKLLDKANE